MRWSVVIKLCLGLSVVGVLSCKGKPSTRPLTVYAAASLTDAFTELKSAYELTHEPVRLVFAGSQILRTQIEQGAPADVFVSANRAHVESLKRRHLILSDVSFATNSLALIVHERSAISTYLALPSAKRVVLGLPDVPVGYYARRSMARVGDRFVEDVMARVVSQEHNARVLATKVEVGEADAAIVYVTDTRHLKHVRVIEIPSSYNVHATYVAGAVKQTKGLPVGSARFLAFLRSAKAKRIMIRHGFSPI